MKKLLFLSLVLLNCVCKAQDIKFYPSDYIKFLGEKNDTLYSAFTGGLSNPMFSQIDLNNDGRLDLFVFDKRDDKVLTYLNIKTRDSVKLIYAPQYEDAFPKIQDWVFLRDFNGDKKPDIFMYGKPLAGFTAQMVVYKNISTGSNIQFELFAAPIKTEMSNGIMGIETNEVEIPEFVDIDNDKDLDILLMDPAYGRVAWHKNMSRELYGHSDSLVFWLVDQCWGRFRENPNSTIQMHLKEGEHYTQNLIRRKKHAGSTLTIFDTNGDGDKDAILSDYNASGVVFLENGRIRQGHPDWNKDSIYYNTTNFPFTNRINMKSMPLVSPMDINGNGSTDIIVSPLQNMDTGSRRNFIWLYNNVSNTSNAIFRRVKTNFLEDNTVDWGLYSAPAIINYDSDSLPDLLLSVRGEIEDIGADHLVLYKNVGTKQRAVFKLEDNDFLGIASEKKKNIMPLLSDVDGDGKADLLLGTDSGKIDYYKNITTNGQIKFQLPAIKLKDKNGADIKVAGFSKPAAADLNNDGMNDLLIGSNHSKIAYYRNVSTGAGTPVFEEVNTAFVSFPIEEKQLAPCLADIDNNGQPDIIIGSASGRIYTFMNISENSVLTTPESNLFYNFRQQSFGVNKTGVNTTIAAASLDQDGKTDLLIGNSRGGLYFMGSVNNGQKTPTDIAENRNKSEELKINIYPNPAQNYIMLKWQNAHSGNMQLILTDVSGKQIWNTILSTNTASNHKVNLPDLSNGLYFLQVSSMDNKVFGTEKLFIAK